MPDEEQVPQHRGRAVSAYHRDLAGKIIAIAIALWLLMIPFRAIVYGYASVQPLNLPRISDTPKLLLIGVYDFAFVALLCLLTLLALAAFRNRRWPQRMIFSAFLLCALVSVAWSAVNVELVRMLGRPLNYQWLYYSDFLRGRDALQAMRAGLGQQIVGIPAGVWYLLGLCLTLFALAWATWAVGKRLSKRRSSSKRLFAAAAIVAAVYVVVGHIYLTSHHWPRPKLMNPALSFFASIVRAQAAPPLFSMETSIGPDDFLVTAERGASNSSATAMAKTADIDNVIIFVLESVPTRYLEIYGGSYSVTPNLASRRAHSLVVDGIYTPAPATNFSLFSLLTSVYPLVSYHAGTKEHPDLSLASLSEEFKRLGYRTGFFYSADLSFQNAREFLDHRSFDTIRDYKDRDCGNRHFTSEQWSYLDTSDDRCTCESFVQWIDEAVGLPLFAVLWTGMTHYPYFVEGEEREYGVGDPYLNKYLNALRQSDEALGHLLAALEERGILDSTLVVVIGDHGEAFKQHGTYGHASGIYEENVNVPLVLLNRRLFAGEEKSTVGGLIDIAPTILDLMGMQSPGSWQGHSIFSSNRPTRTYFFSPWSELLFGFRDGDYKLIFNATTSAFEIYDLKQDPDERSNLAADLPDFIAVGEQRLAAWVQFQQQLFETYLGNDLAPP